MLLRGCSLSVKDVAAALGCSACPAAAAAADSDSRMLLMLYDASLMFGSESLGVGLEGAGYSHPSSAAR